MYFLVYTDSQIHGCRPSRDLSQVQSKLLLPGNSTWNQAHHHKSFSGWQIKHLGVTNEGLDNEDADYIFRKGDLIKNEKKGTWIFVYADFFRFYIYWGKEPLVKWFVAATRKEKRWLSR